MGSSMDTMVAALVEVSEVVEDVGGFAEVRRALAPLAEHLEDEELDGFTAALAVTAGLLERAARFA